MMNKKEQLRQTYAARINRAIDYITENLAGDLNLAVIAKEAQFSPFHFHRVFGAMVGESLNSFIRRVRVEQAAGQLLSYPAEPVTNIALDCGFSSSAAFARAFKEHFGLSASDFRERKTSETKSKNCKTKSKNGKEFLGFDSYISNTDTPTTGRFEMKVEVKNMPEMNVAYVRNIGPYNTVGKAFEKLCAWAGPRGLLAGPNVQFLGVYRDDPNITEPDKLRAEACVAIPKGTETKGEVGAMKIPGGQFAVARLEIDPDGFTEAWNQLMGSWLPESGFEPDDRFCYELYYNTPEDHPEGKFILDICQPVRPL